MWTLPLLPLFAMIFVVSLLGSTAVTAEMNVTPPSLLQSSSLPLIFFNSSNVDSRRRLDFANVACKFLKVTTAMASMVDSFCSGDVSAIVDEFQEMLTGEVSEVTGMACDKIGEQNGTQLLKECESMVENAPVTSLSQDQCTSKGPALIEKMVEECKKKADAMVDKFLDSAEKKVTDKAKELKKKAMKNRKMRKTARKAKKAKLAACQAAPIIAGIGETLHNTACKKVVTDIYIGCADVNEMEMYKNIKKFGSDTVGTPSDYAYNADPKKGYMMLWFNMITDEVIYNIKNGKGHPNWKKTYDTLHSVDPTDNSFRAMFLNILTTNYDSSLETVLDDSAIESKLLSLKLSQKGSAQDVCPYAFTTSFDLELATAQIIDQAKQTTNVDNVFYKEFSAAEFESFHGAVSKSCKDKTVFNMLFQQSNAFEEPLRLKSCISEIVTTEQDRYVSVALPCHLHVAVACLVAIVAVAPASFLWQF